MTLGIVYFDHTLSVILPGSRPPPAHPLLLPKTAFYFGVCVCGVCVCVVCVGVYGVCVCVCGMCDVCGVYVCGVCVCVCVCDPGSLIGTVYRGLGEDLFTVTRISKPDLSRQLLALCVITSS